MAPEKEAIVHSAVERCGKRLWAHCYRMTGRRADADDLSQESIARAIGRAGDLDDAAAVEGWLFRIATTVCLDHLRREKRVRAVTELVDPIVFDAIADPPDGADAVLIRREDVPIAIGVAL